jgi:hypothetical protein
MQKTLKHFLIALLVSAFALALLLMPVQAPPPAYAQGDGVEFWAVIAGVSDYMELNDLDFCHSDAEDLAAELGPVWGEDHIQLLTNADATQGNIASAITDWLAPREDDNDVVLFFFSGHGGRNILCPYDSLIDSYANDIYTYDLNSWLEVLDSPNIIVIIDTCMSGSFVREAAGSGWVVMSACAANEEAQEDHGLRHGVFAYYILEAFREFETADANGDYELSIEEIFNYAQPRTTEYEPSQHPEMGDEHPGELVLLIRVTFDAETDIPQDVDIMTIGGESYSPSELPVSFTWTPGSSCDFELVTSVPAGNGNEHAFSSWSDGSTATSGTITHGGIYTANYLTQYYLTVISAYGDPQGEGWYPSSSTATISVASPQGVIIRQVFSSWSGDFYTTTPSAFIYMNSPMTVTASWRTDYLFLFIVAGAGGLVLIGGIAALVIIMVRKRV